MEMRLIKAVSLLRDPTIKIINVAEQCGFNHLGLFNTCFSKRFGTSPGRWRKTNADSPELKPKAESKNHGNNECGLRAKGLCPWLTTDQPPKSPLLSSLEACSPGTPPFMEAASKGKKTSNRPRRI
jgi:hypothetical protein